MDLEKVLNNVSQDQAPALNYQETMQAGLPTLPSIRDSLGEVFPQSYTAYPHALDTGIPSNPPVHCATGMPLQLLLETHPQQSSNQSSNQYSVQQQVSILQDPPDNQHFNVASHLPQPQQNTNTLPQIPTQQYPSTHPGPAQTCILTTDQPSHNCTTTYHRLGSRFFGFQKCHWGPIPEHVWLHSCKRLLRSHKCQILFATLDRMEAWGGISHFVLSVRFREMIRMESLRGGSLLLESAPPLHTVDGRVVTSSVKARSKPVPVWLHELGDLGDVV